MRNDDDPMPDQSALMRMATAYLARYAASSHRVREVLQRRIRRRCRQQAIDLPEAETMAAGLDTVVARLQQLGLLDDLAFAASRSRSLQRKGLPKRRIHMALRAEGLGADDLHDTEDGIDDQAQARRFAARKRIGANRMGDRASYRDKDLRSLLRAGFSFPVAVAVVDAEPE